MTENFKPLLAGKLDKEKLQFPVHASAKLDGVRAVVIDSVVYYRSLKPVPNVRVQMRYGRPEYNGLDGELIVGAHDEEVFQRTSAVVRSKIHDSDEHVEFWVFDNFSDPTLPYLARHTRNFERFNHRVHAERGIRIVATTEAADLATLEFFHEHWIEQGFEGTMVRSPGGVYKYGRSTTKEGILLKLKDFEDSEAEVIGYEELMHNNNEATTNSLGYTERSSHKDNKVGAEQLGAIIVRDIKTGIEFNIGSGFNSRERQELWEGREGLVGSIVKYQFFPSGNKVKPRFPTFKGFRDKRDMS